MFEYMENVSPNEAENIRKTIQDLLRQTCILQMKCDPVDSKRQSKVSGVS